MSIYVDFIEFLGKKNEIFVFKGIFLNYNTKDLSLTQFYLTLFSNCVRVISVKLIWKPFIKKMVAYISM